MDNIVYINDYKGRKQMINIFELADTFLAFDIMTHKKLQKLCYYAYSWYMVIDSVDNRLINNRFEAWQHGPVCRDLYDKYRYYGKRPICSNQGIPCKIKEDDELFNFISKVYEIYGDYDEDELENLTHEESPWLKARGDLPKSARCSNIISDEDIYEYYSNIE